MITDGFEETPVRTRFNGKQAAFLDVYRIGQQSAIEVADKVKEYNNNKQDSLPVGFKLSFWDDDSEIVYCYERYPFWHDWSRSRALVNGNGLNHI